MIWVEGLRTSCLSAAPCYACACSCISQHSCRKDFVSSDVKCLHCQENFDSMNYDARKLVTFDA